MNKNEFLEKVKDILQYEYDEELTDTTSLSDIEEWDSISIISIAALIDSTGKKATVDELKNIKTVAELLNLAGINE